ncbi:MAG: TonB family protein [Acidobacteria bacterium]|nr:TonB family protein [Acidobacteriota bacterium]
MRNRNDANKFGPLLAAALVAATSLACTFIRDLTGRSVPDGQRILAERVPAGMEHAVEDPEANRPSAFRIIMLDPGKITLKDPESQPIDITTLGSRVQEAMSTKTPDERVVYIAAAADIPTSEVAAVIYELRRQKIETVKLLTSERDPEAKGDGLFAEPVAAPNRVFELQIEPERERDIDAKPNPLLLFVRTGDDGRPVINNETKADLKALTTLLNEIFAERERNGVFRADTNEVEKTVLVKLSTDETDRKYGDLVKLINAVKGGGASPISLAEDYSPPIYRELPTTFEEMPDPSSRKDLSRVISGGVVNGKATFLPKPEYPPAAKAVRASGAVNVEIMIDTDGNVVEAKAVSGHPLLRQSAVTAARSAKFAPTMLAGKPVKVKGVLVFRFNAPE